MTFPSSRGVARKIAGAWILLSLAINFARGQDRPDAIETGIRATALIEVAGPTESVSGSGFCVTKSGLFITNAHVVEPATRGAKIQLVLESGRADQRRVPASLIRIDRALDLALLKVEADPKLVPLSLGGDEKLRHTAEIVTFGFPFGQLNAAKQGDFPDITVLHSRITSLPREGGRLRYIQFDNQLNPGNSGGPVLDETGRVIGVAVKSIQGAAMNRAIPVGLLTAFLAPPALIFTTPVPGHGDRWKPTTWVVEVLMTDPATKPMEGLSVKLTLRAANGTPRIIDAVSSGDGLFKATVTPVSLDPNRKLRLTVRGDGGATRDVEVLDLPIKVGGRDLLLGDIERLDVRTGGAKLVLGSDTVPGAIQGLELLRSAQDQKPVENLAKAVSIDVTETASTTPVRSLEVVAELKQAGKVLSTARRTINLEFPAAAALARTPAAPAVPPNSRVLKDGAGRTVVVTRVPTRGSPEDEAMVSLGGRLDVQGVPRQAGRDLSATRARIGEAEVAKEPPPIPRAPAIHVVNGLPEGIVAIPSRNFHLYSIGFSPDGKTFGIGGDDDLMQAGRPRDRRDSSLAQARVLGPGPDVLGRRQVDPRRDLQPAYRSLEPERREAVEPTSRRGLAHQPRAGCPRRKAGDRGLPRR